MEKEILELFKSYVGIENKDINQDALKYGILISNSAGDFVINEAIKLYGKDKNEWNSTFHKSFDLVGSMDMETLIAQQLLHYFSTYGLEELGIYNSELVYVPTEELDIPDIDVKQIELIHIKAISEFEVKEKIMNMLTSGIALSEHTIENIMNLSDFIDKDKIEDIKNREIKTYLYKKYDMVPIIPEEFLRYLIFSVTGNTLKIQNKDMISDIKTSNETEKAIKLFNLYLTDEIAWRRLSSIFLRNKKIFLAFKTDNKEINHIINKLRKYASKYHKQANKNILDCLSNNFHEDISDDDIFDALNNITIFREIRILNGLLYRISGEENIVYNIRNGKSYVSKLKKQDIERLTILTEKIKSHLIERISVKVKDKTIYIPDNIIYAAPTSEKQFTGEIPNGSCIKIPRDSNIIYGIHWTNISGERVDLDLSQNNVDASFGWDSSWRNHSRGIIFSGDLTDAPKPDGATELFFVNRNLDKSSFLVNVNMYTRNFNDIPFEFVVSKTDYEFNDVTHFRSYTIDPNMIICKLNMKISPKKRNMVIGMIDIDNDIKLYLNDFSFGNYRTSNIDENSVRALDYMKSYVKIQIKLNDILEEAGAIITDTNKIKEQTLIIDKTGEGKIIMTKEKPVDIDLSLENISKETLIELLS